LSPENVVRISRLVRNKRKFRIDLWRLFTWTTCYLEAGGELGRIVPSGGVQIYVPFHESDMISVRGVQVEGISFDRLYLNCFLQGTWVWTCLMSGHIWAI
jgi:hypothetical protein